jgi:hypothetical protein
MAYNAPRRNRLQAHPFTVLQAIPPERRNAGGLKKNIETICYAALSFWFESCHKEEIFKRPRSPDDAFQRALNR